jgi:hypothetical protein
LETSPNVGTTPAIFATFACISADEIADAMVARLPPDSSASAEVLRLVPALAVTRAELEVTGSEAEPVSCHDCAGGAEISCARAGPGPVGELSGHGMPAKPTASARRITARMVRETRFIRFPDWLAVGYGASRLTRPTDRVVERRPCRVATKWWNATAAGP